MRTSTNHNLHRQGRSLDKAIRGCIILYIVRIFSSSAVVEPHIIPLKVCLDVALIEEAK